MYIFGSRTVSNYLHRGFPANMQGYNFVDTITMRLMGRSTLFYNSNIYSAPVFHLITYWVTSFSLLKCMLNFLFPFFPISLIHHVFP